MPMINKWKALGSDNQVKLFIVILGAVFAVIGFFGKDWLESTKIPIGNFQPIVTQTTSGVVSPAVSDTKGDVTINLNTPDQAKQP